VDGRTGLLVPHADAARLADAMGELALRPRRVLELGAGARAFAEGLTWERAARRTGEDLLRVARHGA
jgi:glycosyltransferase involved in cell wall biosynthesis